MMISLIAAATCLIAPSPPEGRQTVLVVVGAPGEPEYGAQFRRSADLWDAAAKEAGAESIRIGTDEESGATDLERLKTALAEQSKAGQGPLWIVLIGHGTFDGREAKFNLRGPDATDAQFAEWLAAAERPIAFINCASASGPFLNRLSGKDRIVITATRSGDEQNYARFGQYLAESIADPADDLDKDGQVSLLEAFLAANGKVAEFYKAGARLATEHALLDDNGDRLGTPADWFTGVRATKRAKDGASPDGLRAHQLHLIPSDRERDIPPDKLKRRDQLELAIAALREKKAQLGEDAYYAQLEKLMIDLARLYREIEGGTKQGRKAPSAP